MTDIINKEMMEQYEAIRQSGATNMFNYYNVRSIANKVEYFALASLSLEDYKILLLNFNKLMKKYNITQN